MLFNSLEFLFFFVIVYALYLPLGLRWQNGLLLASSLIFYAAWNWKFLFVMAASISTDFFCSHQIAGTENPKKRKLFLTISLAVNLGILGFFKYYNFFIGNILGLLQLLHLASPSVNLTLHIILPLGISFYTFEAMSYVLDVYQRRIKPAQNYWEYFLFVVYFPHLIAGPIMRGRDLLPQIASPRLVNGAKFCEGIYLVFLGLFQKMFVADNMARIVNPIFNNGTPGNGADALVAMVAFTFQIFGDFAGYSNMARGLGLMMGFDISVNFNTPYFATNVQEFWNRWHITLSHWIRDYLYLPLMGGMRSIKGNARIYAALMIAMTTIGLWHGAAWHFVVFGAYYGLLLSLYLVIRMRFAKLINPQGPFGMAVWFWARVLFLFLLTVFGMMLFRVQSLGQAGDLLKSIGLYFHPSAMNKENLTALIGFSLPLIYLQWGEFKTNDIFFVLKKHWVLRSVMLAVMAYLLLGWGVMKAEEFIYFQF